MDGGKITATRAPPHVLGAWGVRTWGEAQWNQGAYPTAVSFTCWGLLAGLVWPVRARKRRTARTARTARLLVPVPVASQCTYARRRLTRVAM